MHIRPSSHPPNTRAFTLVEIMSGVAIIALLATIAVPSLLRARKRAQGSAIKNDLRLIDDAMERYASENNLSTGNNISSLAWRLYMKPGTRLYQSDTNIFGEAYGNQKVGTLPAVPSSEWDMLIDVCDSSFWAPYGRSP